MIRMRWRWIPLNFGVQMLSLLLWIGFVLALAWVPSIKAGADILMWQDAEGVIHFSNGDAPPQAELYLVEPPDTVQPEISTLVVTEPREPNNPEQETLKAQLHEANQKLSQSIEKMEELTQKVEAAQHQADRAAQAAVQAAEEAERLTDASDPPVQERVVFYGLPYRPEHRPGHRPDRPKSEKPPFRYDHMDSSRYPYYHFGEPRDENHPLYRGPSAFQKKYIQKESPLSNVQQLKNRTETKHPIDSRSTPDASQEAEMRKR